MNIHLDTDFGGDPDDACALAMLLGWHNVNLVGITTTIDPNGLRASQVRHFLNLIGRADIPVESGATQSLTTNERADPVVGDERFWPLDLAPHPSEPGAALELLQGSIRAGATIAAIGPASNFALLEESQPGALDAVPVSLMGGWLNPPQTGLPHWGPEMDFNVQWDSEAARVLGESAAALTLVTLPVTLKAHLRGAHLARLRASGPLGALLARQSEAHAELNGMTQLARANPGLPADLLNFHYDPVTCAVALGWEGAEIEEKRLRPVNNDGVLTFTPHPDGRVMRIVTDIDGDEFSETWLAAVEAAQRPSPR